MRSWHAGLVSAALDPLFGVVALDLDAALRVQFALDVIGGPDSVLDGSVINEGAKQRCLGGFQSIYCEWEWWFRDDLSSALELSIDQVQVIFVKDAGKGLSMVHFRLLPQSDLDIVGGVRIYSPFTVCSQNSWWSTYVYSRPG